MEDVETDAETLGTIGQVRASGRGFKHLEPVQGTYAGRIKVYESSAASAPHVWVMIQQAKSLNDPDGEWIDATVHLDVEGTIRLRDQLNWILRNHYQGDCLLEESDEPRPFSVTYEIHSLIDSGIVSSDTIPVVSKSRKMAGLKAVAWVQEHDPYYDPRIDPYVSIVSIEEEDD